jgi:hypothetical protein
MDADEAWVGAGGMGRNSMGERTRHGWAQEKGARKSMGGSRRHGVLEAWVSAGERGAQEHALLMGEHEAWVGAGAMGSKRMGVRTCMQGTQGTQGILGARVQALPPVCASCMCVQGAWQAGPGWITWWRVA